MRVRKTGEQLTVIDEVDRKNANTYGIYKFLRGVRLTVGGSVATDPYADHPLTLMTPGTWYEYTGATLSTLSPDPTVSLDSPLTSQEWSDVNGNTGFAGFFAYSGGVVARNALWVNGGGHNDYYGNEWYKFDFAAMEWQRHNWPDIDEAENYLIPDGFADNTSRPSSYHTYNGLAYSQTSDVFLRAGGSPAGTDTQLSGGREWIYNPDTDAYTLLNLKTGAGYDPDGRASNGAICTCWDSVNNRFWIVTSGGLWSRDATNPATATCRINWYYGSPSYGETFPQHNGLVHDPVNNLLVAIGSTHPMIFDIASPNAPSVESYNGTWTGNGSAIARTAEVGLVYDAGNDEIIAWSGGENIYVVDPVAMTITTESPGGGNTVTPTNPAGGGGGGPFGRFFYAGQWGGDSIVGVVNSVSGSVYFYKRA